jgi:hypothetical protein
MIVIVIISSHPKNPFVTRVLDHVRIFSVMVYFTIFKLSSFHHLALNIFLVGILRMKMKRIRRMSRKKRKLKENVTG